MTVGRDKEILEIVMHLRSGARHGDVGEHDVEVIRLSGWGWAGLSKYWWVGWVVLT